MAIDFSNLVLAPAMTTFALSIQIIPTVSQPNYSAPALAPQAYVAQGIWTVQDVDVLLEDGSTLASKSYILGIRFADYLIPPVKGDGVVLNAANYVIDQVRPDGQGGARLILKAMQ